jgi:hypothetical protein
MVACGTLVRLKMAISVLILLPLMPPESVRKGCLSLTGSALFKHFS